MGPGAESRGRTPRPGLAFRRALGAFGWIKRHYQWVMRTGGAMLILVGVLLITGAWDQLIAQLRYWAAS